MDTQELLTAIRDALAADEALNAWCKAQFGTGATVFLGIDDASPPTPDDYPVVAVMGADQARGQAGLEHEWNVEIGVGVENSKIDISGDKITRTGLLQAEKLRELAEDAVYRARILPMETRSESFSEYRHPVYQSFSVFTIRQAASSRKGLPG